jgi:microsomal dipeptidase-like Zn-dependent dipeptidase
MKYFDFHTHIVLKQLLSDNPNLDAMASRNDVAGIPRMCTDLPNIIESQIHQSQLAEFDEEVIVGLTLYSVEKHLAAEVIKLRGLLKGSSQHKLSETLLKSIVDNSQHAFSDFIMKRTVDNCLHAPQSLNVLQVASLNQALPKNKVNVFFVVEGCHSLVDTNNESTPFGHEFPPLEILTNLDNLLSRVPVIAINPTHMQQSNLCNHAFAIQITGVEHFIPRGNGLTDDGRQVIQGMFDRRICVDTKHMSFKSRLDLRNEIDAGKFNNVQPVVCTHTGFTGVSFSNWPGFFARKDVRLQAVHLEIAKTMQTHNMPPRPGAPAFNSSSINLFDEEIVWIVQHGGMIGLSLDRRIIGYVSKHDPEPTGRDPQSELVVDKEFISPDEWLALGIPDSAIGISVNEDDCVKLSDLEESAEGSIPSRDEYFFDHIHLQLKHYLQVCHDAGISIAQAQKHICIGSDFDGLINPFINIPTVKDMDDLKRNIRMNFHFFLETLEDSKLWHNELQIDQFVEDLFFNNGFNFIKSRL